MAKEAVVNSQTQGDFNNLTSPMELDLTALFSQVRDEMIELSNKAVKEGWKEEKYINEVVDLITAENPKKVKTTKDNSESQNVSHETSTDGDDPHYHTYSVFKDVGVTLETVGGSSSHSHVIYKNEVLEGGKDKHVHTLGRVRKWQNSI